MPDFHQNKIRFSVFHGARTFLGAVEATNTLEALDIMIHKKPNLMRSDLTVQDPKHEYLRTPENMKREFPSHFGSH